MEELENVPKELKVSATLWVEQQYELTSIPELLSLAAHVSEDGLANFICPSTGEHKGQEFGVGELGSRAGEGYRGVSGWNLKCR